MRSQWGLAKQPPEKPQPAKASTSRMRRVGFRVAAILIGLLPFGIAEFCLQAIDWPGPESASDPFLDCSQLAPLFTSDREGHYHIPAERLRLFAPAEFRLPKPANTARVFSLGGSTTQGEPYGPPTAFSQFLGLNLELIDPNRKWEMINCGGLSYASYRVLPILREVLEYDPDLIVIYCGQNEFLEARELQGWKQTSVATVRLISNLYRLKLVQLAVSLVKPRPSTTPEENGTTRLQREVDALLDSQGGLEKYRRASLNAPAVVASFRWNLQQMVNACQAYRIPWIVIVPTVNLRDCPPFKVETDPQLDLESAKRVESLWQSAQDNHDQPTKARQAMEGILAIDPLHAGAHYYLGQLAIAESDWEPARQHLIAAKDNDVCPLRATSDIQQAVRQVATESRSWVLDADALFQAKSPQALVGRRWLIDHVHPGIEGHQILGEALADLLVEKAWIAPASENWRVGRVDRYRSHLAKLGEAYFIRGRQRLEGLLLWTQGRAKKIGAVSNVHEPEK